MFKDQVRKLFTLCLGSSCLKCPAGMILPEVVKRNPVNLARTFWSLLHFIVACNGGGHTMRSTQLILNTAIRYYKSELNSINFLQITTAERISKLWFLCS